MNKKKLITKIISLVILLNLGILIPVLFNKFYNSSSINFIDLLIYIFFNSIFLYGIYLNLMWVIKEENKNQAFVFNLCYWGLQIFAIKIFGIIYYIDTTINLGIFLLESNNNWNFGYIIRLFNFAYSFYITNDSDHGFSINFSALILFILLKWSSKKVIEN